MRRAFVYGRRIGLLVCTLLPVTASAQTIARNFQELSLNVKPGETVYVTDDTGQERRAEIVDLSPSSLLVSMDGARRDLSEGDVKRIRQHFPDRLWNGAVIGAVIGGAVGISPVLLVCGQAEEITGKTCGEIPKIGPLIFGGAIGAGVGWAFDALIEGRKTIYEASGSGSPLFSVAPVFTKGVRGVQVAIKF